MASSHNPFSPPELAYRDLIPQEYSRLQKHARKLAMLRLNPPTIVGLIGNWRMLLAPLFGLLLTLFAAWNFREFNRPYNTYPALVVASMFLGMYLRDVAHIVRFVRGWKLAAHFVDWDKVDALR